MKKSNNTLLFIMLCLLILVTTSCSNRNKGKIDYYSNDENYIEVTGVIDYVKFDDYLNKSGVLTSYIKNEMGVEIPSLFLRKKYFHEHGSQWHEQWFDIISIKKDSVLKKKCPYCNWETVDIKNRSGMFATHLLKEHGINKMQYIKEHPEDKSFFSLANPTLNRKLETNEDKFVKCAICGEKFARIDWRHLSKHNITETDYKFLYCNKTVSNELSEKMSKIVTKTNENMTPVYTSKPQLEIYNFIKSKGIECELNNRKVLHGTELDIYIPSLKIGIEYNGNFWHTEGMNNKNPYSHLNKTEMCKKEGVKLIQIFEDEYFLKKEITYKKISHLLHIQENKIKIGGRNCIVHEIHKYEAEVFLNKNHIQGHVDSTVYLGAFFGEEIIGVMNFKREFNEENKWELTRFATNNDYICSGVGGKLFNYFIKHFEPEEIKSFADRRWTINEDNNLYTKIGFYIEKYLKPDYKYYNEKIDRYQRFHKFGFRKEKLSKKYGLPLTMTEKEMAEKLGYKRIWDCGLIKYIWRKKNE